MDPSGKLLEVIRRLDELEEALKDLRADPDIVGFLSIWHEREELLGRLAGIAYQLQVIGGPALSRSS